MILRSIIRGVLALFKGYTDFWLVQRDYNLILYSSYYLRDLFDKLIQDALGNNCFIYIHAQACPPLHRGLGFLLKERLLAIYLPTFTYVFVFL
jgi:hypothetical protein